MNDVPEPEVWYGIKIREIGVDDECSETGSLVEFMAETHTSVTKDMCTEIRTEQITMNVMKPGKTHN